VKRVWSFSFYFWQFAAVAFYAAYFVLYYQKLGFTGAEIGLLAGLSPIVTLVCAPLWTGLADATRRHRLILSLAVLGTTGALSMFPFLNAFMPVLALGALLSAFSAPVTPLADTATMRLLGENRQMYGRLRLGGTVGYALAAAIAGVLVQRYGLPAAFWGGAGLYALTLLSNQNLWVPAPVAKAGPVSVGGGSRALMTNPRWLLFLVGGFSGGVMLAATNSYLFSYLQELGASEGTMGLALTLGTLVEVPVLFFGNHLLRWLKPYRLYMVALVISAARMLLLGMARDANQVLVIQLLTGLTFPPMWIAGVAYAHDSAPPGLSATAQGIFGATVFGFGMAVGGFAGGPLLTSIGARNMFLVIGLAMLVLVLLVAGAGRLLPAARVAEAPAEMELSD
jgi:MFS transporter, PPP family, 3-phenylpropionic acid transporter